MLIAIFSLS